MPAKPRPRHDLPSLEGLLPPARPPAPPAPPLPEPPAAPRPVAATVEEQAAYLRDIAWPAALYGSLAGGVIGGIKNLKVHKALIDDFVAEVGAAGALGRMAAEQLLLAHHLIGQLSAKGMGAAAPDAAKVYLGAAARLMGEFRAHASALTALRTPAVPVPAAAPQPPPPPAPPAQSTAPPAPVARNELGSNRVKGYYRAAPAEAP